VLLILAAVCFGAVPELARCATFSVLDFGAQTDGLADATPAFAQAIDEAAKTAGSVVYAPAGRYLIAGSIRLKPNMVLRGDYDGLGRERGTVLLSTFAEGQVEGPGCIVMAPGCVVRNVAITYPAQDPQAAEPLRYPYAITGAPSTQIEQVYLHNAYQGLDLDGCHLNLVRNVWGEPLRVGIHCDHTYDISRIENVHFWPYFTLGQPLREWVQQNGVAYEFGRSDWQSVVNAFSYGYHTGFRFFATEGDDERKWPAGTTNGSFFGIGADRAIVGIDVEGCFDIGVSVTNAMIGPFGAVDESRGVLLRETNTGNLSLVNCNFWAVTNMVAEVRAGSLSLTGCNVHAWALLKKDAPCFRVTGGRLKVNDCTFNQGGFAGDLSGELTRVLFAGNLGPQEPLTVVSQIGDRFVRGLNNPPIVLDEQSP